MYQEWRGKADGFARPALSLSGGDWLIVDGREVRALLAGEYEVPIPRDKVIKVYVCRSGLNHGLCFELENGLDYAFWCWWRRRGAEEAWQAVKRARYPVTRSIYRPGYGRLARWGVE